MMNDYLKQVDSVGIRKFFKMAAEYDDVLSLTIGEPDFQTPFHIREAAIQALQQGKTFYAPIEGFLTLREAISRYLLRKFSLSYCPKNEMFVTVGASEAIDLAFRAFINPGDEVIVFQPSFVSYQPLAQLMGARLVIVDTCVEDEFKVTYDLLKSHLTAKTRIIILCYPNNPTGAIMTYQDYEVLVPLLETFEGLIISDEIYAELSYGPSPHASLAHFPSIKDKVLYVSGFSKAFSMTGWRLGYVCGDSRWIEPMITIHQYSLMCSPTISQFAAIEACDHGDDGIIKMKEQYQLRRQYLVNRLIQLGLKPFAPKGAFYVFCDIRSTGLSSETFCRNLLDEMHVAVIPGTAFGLSGEGFIRISYSYSLAHIKSACDKIEIFLKNRTSRIE